MDGVNVSRIGAAAMFPRLLPVEEYLTLTLALGWLFSLTVKVAVVPSRMVMEVADNTMAGVGVGVGVGLDELALAPDCWLAPDDSGVGVG